jgi:hypothetical protein
MNQKLKPVVETLQAVFMPIPMGSDLRDAFETLTKLVDGACDSQEVMALDPAEARALHGFRIGLHRFASMEPDMLAKHTLAQWRSVIPAMKKLSIGPVAAECIKQIDSSNSDTKPPEWVGQSIE